MEKHFTPAQAAELLSVSVQTLRAWDRDGKIKVIRTPGNQRRISESEVVRLLSNASTCDIDSNLIQDTRKMADISRVEFPQNILEEDKLEYRCLQLTSSLFSTFKDYWGYSIQNTLDIFQEKGIYAFIRDNYEFYHTVGEIYIVEDVCECLELPKGSWVR